MTHTPTGRRAAAGLVLIAALALLPGCGPSDGTVAGTITLAGTPLPGAQVSFLSPDGLIVTAIAGDDGTYRAEHVPFGVAKVTVYTASTLDPTVMGDIIKNQGRAPGKAKAAPTGLPVTPVPARYSDAASSGLTVTVDKPETKYDIPLDQ